MRWLLPVVLLVSACGTPEPAGTDEPSSSTNAATSDSSPSSTIEASTDTTEPGSAEETFSTSPYTTEFGYPADETGRRLVYATAEPPTLVCDTVVFWNGDPPPSVDGSEALVGELVPTAPEVTSTDGTVPFTPERTSFYSAYDWTAVFASDSWTTLLGVANGNGQDDMYSGSHATADFALVEGAWTELEARPCTPKPSPLPYPSGTVTVTQLWPSDVIDAVIAYQAGTETEEQRDFLFNFGQRGEVTWGAPSIAIWQLDPEIPYEPGSTTVHLMITEGQCASGQAPEDRDVYVFLSQDSDGTTLSVYVENYGGTCPSNPWYPIVVELPAPPADGTFLGASPHHHPPDP